MIYGPQRLVWMDSVSPVLHFQRKAMIGESLESLQMRGGDEGSWGSPGLAIVPQEGRSPGFPLPMAPGGYWSKSCVVSPLGCQEGKLLLPRLSCLPVSLSLSLLSFTACSLLSLSFFSFSVNLYWSGVSRPVKYINEFLAPALCTQVIHWTSVVLWLVSPCIRAWSCQLTPLQTFWDGCSVCGSNPWGS